MALGVGDDGFDREEAVVGVAVFLVLEEDEELLEEPVAEECAAVCVCECMGVALGDVGGVFVMGPAEAAAAVALVVLMCEGAARGLALGPAVFDDEGVRRGLVELEVADGTRGMFPAPAPGE